MGQCTIYVQIRCQTLHMLLPGWLESTLSRFVIIVSWWRSLSLIFNIVIIAIFMILYVKVFTKLGNTPFEHFSRHCYIISKSSNLIIHYLDLSMTYWAEDLKLRFGCLYYDMSFEKWRNTVLRYMFLEFSILVCDPFRFGFYLWFIK